MKEISRRVFEKHLDKIDREERRKEKRKMDKLKSNKHYKCPYSTFTGTKLFCMMPRCMKGR
ncbi:hypothetical protein [Natronincola ferrireducens]|uniref:Uncharacterized protein n=1 Tax=Natronincola ferrireducens TaxID=393762 RepID=A0A1G9I4D1_9FIRM|nr:hypothetical protein [Natronincola ferrireducens]SDL19952.1 hypothetical protein SAMN05660472_02792 [Natronincola ferrireducens]